MEKKIAVIENEYGEVGIDDALVIKSDEEVFEMNNGCICCTVRGDLIRILNRLAKRKDKFEYILIETTGLADPSPVAQTFFVDETISNDFALDGIITVVDCKHLLQHLLEKKPENTENEAVEQIAFADRILLNKIDLVTEEEKENLKSKIKAINSFAPLIESQYGKINLDTILGINAFNLTKILELDPEFLIDQEHTHDLSVSSVGISCKGTADDKKMYEWLQTLLREKGADIFRMKGIINVKGMTKKFVFQGVHMLLDCTSGKEWAENEERANKMVFIGRNLNRTELINSFNDCLSN